MNIKKRGSTELLGLTGICALFLSACGGAATNSINTANAAPNINSANIFTSNNSVNAMTDTNISNINVTANANKTNIHMKTEIIIDEDFLGAALKTRLHEDDVNKHFTPEQWDGDFWLDTEIGKFYKGNDEFVNKTVREVTINSLALVQRKITKVSLKRLEAKVSPATACKIAVGEMLTATLDAKPTPIP